MYNRSPGDRNKDKELYKTGTKLTKSDAELKKLVKVKW